MRLRSMVVLSFIILVLVLAMAITVWAGSVTLTWDPYTDYADGIRIYASKTSPVEIVPANMVGATIGTATNEIFLNHLPNGMTYFIATAYWQELESAPSNEVSGVLKPNRVINLGVQ